MDVWYEVRWNSLLQRYDVDRWEGSVHVLTVIGYRVPDSATNLCSMLNAQAHLEK